MRTRRSHNKSRGGCQRCKTRKIKCDEEKPSCSFCAHRGTACVYADTVMAHVQQPRSPLEAIPPPTQSTARIELALMYQYTADTWRTCAINGKVEQQLWQRHIPSLAMDHDCLLHALFCLTSLHIAHLDPDRRARHVVLAREYRQLAIVATSEALTASNDAAADAIFWASSLLGLISLATYQIDAVAPRSASTLAVELSGLWRGSEAIVKAGQQSDCEVNASWDRVAANPASHGRTELQRRDSGLADVLDRLESCIVGAHTLTESGQTRMYLDAVNHLVDAIVEYKTNGSGAPIIAWLPCIDGRVVRNMQAKEPLACLIGMFFGLHLAMLKHTWYIQDLGVHLIQELTLAIPLTDKRWVSLSNWVRERICT